MTTRPPKRRSNHAALPQPRKRFRSSRIISPSSLTPSGDALTNPGETPPVRIMIFRGGTAYAPPVESPPPSHATEDGECRSVLNPPEASSPVSPKHFHSSQGIQSTACPLQRMDRRVRLLLPQTAAIVAPGFASPGPAQSKSALPKPNRSTAEPNRSIAEANPSLWMKQHDGMLATQEEVLNAATYYASWAHAPEHRPSIEESLERLTAARMEMWTARQRTRLRLERIEHNLLVSRREAEALRLKAESA